WRRTRTRTRARTGRRPRARRAPRPRHRQEGASIGALAMRTATVIVTIVVTVAALARVSAACPGCGGKRSDPMHAGFDKAHTSFRDHAARVLKLAPDRVLVSPIEEDPSVQLDQRIGAAWAFYGSSKDHPDRQFRGWAIADGTVITPDQNLGLLLAEAGVW